MMKVIAWPAVWRQQIFPLSQSLGTVHSGATDGGISHWSWTKSPGGTQLK